MAEKRDFLYVRLTPAQAADLERRAAAVGLSKSTVARRAIWPPYGFAPGEIADEVKP